MKPHRGALVLSLLALAVGAGDGSAQDPPPVFDVHLHAMGVNDQGPAPVAICSPFTDFPEWDPSTPYPMAFGRTIKQPPCDQPLWSPETDDELRDGTIAVMRRHNVYGVLSGSPERVRSWQEAAPGRFVPGLGFQVGPNPPPPDTLRAWVERDAVQVLAEVTNQYLGVAPGDDRMEPYWALAEELDLPVGIHMGPGPPGVSYLGASEYRAALSSPLLLEDVLVAHPGLRVYVMHAGFPMLDDVIALMYAHPQVHVGLGVIVYTQPRAAFYRYLEALVEAGFGNRIMFGSDQMVWPEAIERGIAAIDEAPFLSEAQKRAILWDNAIRFLRLDPSEPVPTIPASTPRP